LIEQDSKTLLRLLPEIPQWVKNPDYDRVRYSPQLSFAFNYGREMPDSTAIFLQI
jgi:hypothetical protein